MSQQQQQQQQTPQSTTINTTPQINHPLSYTHLDASSQTLFSTLWSWYILHLALGEYETITKDLIKLRQLDQFIMKFNSDRFNGECMIFVLPLQEFNRGSYLEEILTRYYQHQQQQYKEIGSSEGGSIPEDLEATPLGMITQEDIIIMVKDKSAEGTRDLHAGSIPELQRKTSCGMLMMDSNSFISGEPGFVSSTASCSSAVEDLINSVDSLSMRGEESNTESVIGRLSTPLTRVATNNSYCSSITSSNIYDNESYISQTSSECPSSQYPSTINISDSNDINLSIIVFKNLQNNTHKIAIRQISRKSEIPIEENDEEVEEEDEFTEDSWILYDDDFNFKNLQLLTLAEILELRESDTRILIYSGVELGKPLNADDEEQEQQVEEEEIGEYDSDNESLDSEIGEHDLTVMEFDGHLPHLQTTLSQSSSPESMATTNNTIKFIPTSSRATSFDLTRSETIQSQLKSIKSELYLANSHTSWSVKANTNSLIKTRSNPNSSSVVSNSTGKHRFGIGKRFKNNSASGNSNGIVKVRSHGQTGEQKCALM